MKDVDVDRIARNPKYASYKSKRTKKSRTVHDLFEGVEQEASYKDKRGRPWLKNPRAYVKQQLKKSKEEKTDVGSSEEDDFEEQTSSSSESTQDVDPYEAIADICDADWNELTKDAAPATQIGRRLALLHFDWDNAKADNIYMVLESFLPPKGHIERVTVYPSEFGMKRLAEESIKGPPELLERSTSEASDVEDEEKGLTEEDPVDFEDRSGWRKASTRLKRRVRRYQLARLKYFYAIIEFDSAQTAEAVYNACDGFEYESSGARLDLRFVGDDEVFSVPPEHAHLVSECREINRAKYAPRPFETSALHSTRIGCSWEKTPDERTIWLRDQFKEEADPKVTLTENRDQLEKYLALSSSGASTAASSDVDEPPPAPTVPRVRRHRPNKLPPAELRAALLNALGEDSGQPMEEDDEDVGEEVVDLNDPSDSSDEEYDLGPVEKVPRSDPAKGRRRISRTILPEALDPIPDSSDNEDADSEGGQEKRKNAKRNKHKEKQRAKMLAKKRKIQERLDQQATLWPDVNAQNSESLDIRFDEFLTNPAFRISQTHPDYKEAAEFLRYMRSRKSLLDSTQQSAT